MNKDRQDMFNQLAYANAVKERDGWRYRALRAEAEVIKLRTLFAKTLESKEEDSDAPNPQSR